MVEMRRAIADEDRVPELMCPPPYDVPQQMRHQLRPDQAEMVLVPVRHQWAQKLGLLTLPVGDGAEIKLGEAGFYCTGCLTTVNNRGEFEIPFVSGPPPDEDEETDSE